MAVHPSLTLVFTPPPACTSTRYLAALEYSTIIQETVQQSSSCFAPGWTSATNRFAKGANTWSGIPLCPSGQSVAATSTDVKSQVTAVCCSSNWGNAFTNINVISSSTFSFWVCQSSFSVATTTIAMPTDMTGQTTITGTGAMESTAEYLFLYNRAELTSTSSTTSTSTPAALSSIPSSSSSSSSTTVQTTNTPAPGNVSSNGLGINARAGIGFGISLLGLGILGVALFYFFRHRRRALIAKEKWQSDYGRHELPGKEAVIVRSELMAVEQSHELDARKKLVELPAA
ncbi:hypothetical protein BGZ60DRAFT_223048 [Tricladium varicosporioides]|nr:hypothetical protein BGZ60DRAFT_223048 [Hymenoscyphus varicosporioides]